MKRTAIVLAVVAVLGSASAYDDNLAWVYDTSGRPADAVSVQAADMSGGVDARANVAVALEASPSGATLESRGWTSWIGEILKLERLGAMLRFW